jgi:RNA-binding protein
MIKFTSKQRAYVRSLAHGLEAIIHIGKNGVSPELTTAVDEALEKRELIKVNVLSNCFEDPKVLAETLAGRTRSTVVQVIGRRITLYRESKDNKVIEIPKEKPTKSK